MKKTMNSKHNIRTKMIAATLAAISIFSTVSVSAADANMNSSGNNIPGTYFEQFLTENADTYEAEAPMDPEAERLLKKIADKLYASDRDLHAGKNFDIASLPDNKKVLPTFKDGDRSILDRLFSEFNVTVGNLDNSQSLFVTTTNENGVVMLEPVSTRKAVVPNVVGMGLRDAMYLLRMKHLKVTVVGRGVVKKQSIPANTDIKGGEKITIELAIN